VGDWEVGSKNFPCTLDDVKFGCVATVEEPFAKRAWVWARCGHGSCWGRGPRLGLSGVHSVAAVSAVGVRVSSYGQELVGSTQWVLPQRGADW
jgi:hypothetical protein